VLQAFREREQIRGLLWVLVQEVWFRLRWVLDPPPSSLCLPFYSFQGEGSDFIRGKGVKTERMKEKNKNGGLGRSRPSPYLVEIVPL
jgi:hypothetical protein